MRRSPLLLAAALAGCASPPPAGTPGVDAREDSLLAAQAPLVTRRADSLVVGRVLFVDDTASADGWRRHAYDGPIERTPFHGVRVSLHEGRAYTLVNPSTGAQALLHARPVASPRGSRLATASLDLEAGFDPNALAILVPDGDSAAVVWHVEPDAWGPDSLAWRGNDTLHVVQRWTTGTPGAYERREALVVRNAGGTWDLVQDPAPATP
jgi:hypothetical protein